MMHIRGLLPDEHLRVLAAGAAVPIESYHTTLRPSWLLLLLLIVDQLVYRAVLLLRHIYHPAHAFYLKKMKNVSCEYD